MTTLFGPILAAAVLAQFQGGPLEGKVVDDQGRPVDGAQIAFHLPVPWRNTVDSVDLRATTNRDGRFRMVLPSLRGGYAGRRLWAFGAAAVARLEQFPASPMLDSARQRVAELHSFNQLGALCKLPVALS